VFLRYACIRLLGLGFTDGFFSFSCWGDRRRLMAYWAVADWLLLFLVQCAKDMGRVLVWLRGGMGLWRKKDWSVVAELCKSGL
jgi:hypothetical protein